MAEKRLYRHLLRTCVRIDANLQAGHSVRRAVRSGLLLQTLESVKSCQAFENLLRHETKHQGDVKSALRSFFVDPDKANRHVVTIDGRTVTFTGSITGDRVDTAFSALRLLGELAAVTDELSSKKCFSTRRRQLERSVRYGVGEQCMHAEFGRVIVFGWDPVHDDNDFSSQYVDHPCSMGYNQPYYRVVCLELPSQMEIIRYVCQEKLSSDVIDRLVPILHPSFVHLFPKTHPSGKFFLPNEDLALCYPDDIEALEAKYAALEGASSTATATSTTTGATCIVSALQSSQPEVVTEARNQLSGSWFQEQGVQAAELLTRARQLREDGRAEESVDTLLALAEQYDSETWPEVTSQLALSYLAVGDSQSASELFHMVLQCRPLHFEALEAVAGIFSDKGEWASARTAALRLQILMPHSPLAEQVIASAEDHQPAPKFQADATDAYRAGGAVDRVPETWTN